METPKPISLHVEAPLNQLSEVTTSYSQQVVDEYMNNPAAPIQKYRPQAIGYEGTYGWSEVAMHFRLTSASADFESGKPIKNDQITSSFRCF